MMSIKQKITANHHPDRFGSGARFTEIRGLSLIEISVVLVLLSLLVSGIYSRATNVGDDVRVKRALEDSLSIMSKALNYRLNQGSYASVSLTRLNSDGYSLAPISSGTSQNPWGLDYQLAPVSNNSAQVMLRITAPNSAICSRLEDELDGLIANQVSVACSNTNNIVTVTAR